MQTEKHYHNKCGHVPHAIKLSSSLVLSPSLWSVMSLSPHPTTSWTSFSNVQLSFNASAWCSLPFTELMSLVIRMACPGVPVIVVETIDDWARVALFRTSTPIVASSGSPGVTHT